MQRPHFRCTACPVTTPPPACPPRSACFAPWWQWQQQQLAAREAQLHREYRAMAPLKLQQEGIRQEAAPARSSGGAAGASTPPGAGCEGAAGAAEGAPATAKELRQAYVLACPACRAEVPPSSLAFAWRQLQVGSHSVQSSGCDVMQHKFEGWLLQALCGRLICALQEHAWQAGALGTLQACMPPPPSPPPQKIDNKPEGKNGRA